MCGHTAVTDGLIVKFLQEILENIIYSHPGKKIPLSDGFIQCFWNIALIAKRKFLKIIYKLARNDYKYASMTFLVCIGK